MHDPIPIPACFSASAGPAGVPADDPSAAAFVTRAGQAVFISIYRTKIADKCRLITVTWCRNLLLHGLSVAVDSSGDAKQRAACKVELKPWYFWRRTGSKRFALDGGRNVDVFWDLRNAKFSDGEAAEPTSDFYVAVACDQEVVLLLGDLKNEAYRKSRCRPALIDPILVFRKEHVFGKKRFATRARFHEKGRVHKISIECENGSESGDPEMEIRVDGQPVVQVKHLQWKFRGNETMKVGSLRAEVYWDVHDWLFSPGLRHALFAFKPMLGGPSGLGSVESGSGLADSEEPNGSSEFCLFLYAWRVE